MTPVIMDASVAIRILLPDQQGHETALETLGELLRNGHEILAPDLFPYEVGNVLRRFEGSAQWKMELLLDALGLTQIAPLGVDNLGRAMELALEMGLSYYDASYVALAEERRGILWTEDQSIRRKAPALAAGTDEILQRAR